MNYVSHSLQLHTIDIRSVKVNFMFVFPQLGIFGLQANCNVLFIKICLYFVKYFNRLTNFFPTTSSLGPSNQKLMSSIILL